MASGVSALLAVEMARTNRGKYLTRYFISCPPLTCPQYCRTGHSSLRLMIPILNRFFDDPELSNDRCWPKAALEWQPDYSVGRSRTASGYRPGTSADADCDQVPHFAIQPWQRSTVD